MIPPVVRASRAQAEQIARQLIRHNEAPTLTDHGPCSICALQVSAVAAIEHALDAAVLAAKAEERERALREAQQAVVEACGACDGQGWIIGVETGDGHDCDGTEAMCAQRCPVPVPVQVQEQCEYCGRPSAAILALIRARGAGEET